MSHIIVTTRDGEEHQIPAEVGKTFLEIMQEGDIDEIVGLCGGCLSCATCHIYVDPKYFSKLPPKSDDEDILIDSSGVETETSRLGCQVTFENSMKGMRVSVAPED